MLPYLVERNLSSVSSKMFQPALSDLHLRLFGPSLAQYLALFSQNLRLDPPLSKTVEELVDYPTDRLAEVRILICDALTDFQADI